MGACHYFVAVCNVLFCWSKSTLNQLSLLGVLKLSILASLLNATSTDLFLYSAFTNDVVPVQLIHELGFSFIYKVWVNMFDLLYCCGNLLPGHVVCLFFCL